MTSAPRRTGQYMRATWQALIAARPSRSDAHVRGKPPAAATWGAVAGSRRAAGARALAQVGPWPATWRPSVGEVPGTRVANT
jgi:hypothetical protein